MKKKLFSVLKISLAIALNISFVACADKSEKAIDNIYELGYKGYSYGYDLPKAKTTANIDISHNIIKCTSLKTVAEQTYCTIGVLFKAKNEKALSQESLQNIPIDMISEFANKQFHYIGHPGYGIYKK